MTIANALAATTPSNTAAGANTTTTTNDALSSATDPLANEQVFLQMLVSQIQNQDPLNPTDSTQFVSQLTGFSQLEQLIGIKGELSSATVTPTQTTTGTQGTGNGN